MTSNLTYTPDMDFSQLIFDCQRILSQTGLKSSAAHPDFEKVHEAAKSVYVLFFGPIKKEGRNILSSCVKIPSILEEQKVLRENNNGVICYECGLLHKGQLNGGHLKKHHDMTMAEYKIKYPDSKILSDVETKIRSERVKGDKNPAYNHGGRLSPWSSKFIGYETEDDFLKGKENVKTASKTTKRENPQNDNTKLEYYIARGMSLDEAISARSERQSVFTFQKCILKYGEDEGKRVWQDRQNRWQESLYDRPKEEMDDINRRKSSKINYSSLWGSECGDPGMFYIFRDANKQIKFGITSRTLKQRYKQSASMISEIVFLFHTSMNRAFMIEQIIKTKYHKYRIEKDDDVLGFGWTEMLKAETPVDDLLSFLDSIKIDDVIFDKWIFGDKRQLLDSFRDD